MSKRADPGVNTPLTVIGGFLGAGKTTLLNRILAEAQGRYAVLVNDFGAVNVDAGLIAEHDGETMRLTNGCVCCSLGDNFLNTLLKVLREDPPFDHIVIEASGVGDPMAIAEIALVEPTLRLGAVIVLADAERIAALLVDRRLGDTVASQVRAADILLLNKVDLVDAAGLAAARVALTGLRPNLRIVETREARVPGEVLDMSETGAEPRNVSRFKAEAIRHEELFHRILYRRDAPFDAARLDRALAELPASLLRLKGRVALASGEARVLQLVGARWALTPAREGGAATTELVGIAQEAGAANALERVLDRALSAPAATTNTTISPNRAQRENAA